jgi:hypothetical protein
MSTEPDFKPTRYDVFDPGFQIDDDLTVVEHLGGSRKVDICLCRNKKYDGLVACKILRARYTIDYSSLEAVMEEGHRLLGLRHPKRHRRLRCCSGTLPSRCTGVFDRSDAQYDLLQGQL